MPRAFLDREQDAFPKSFFPLQDHAVKKTAPLLPLGALQLLDIAVFGQPADRIDHFEHIGKLSGVPRLGEFCRFRYCSQQVCNDGIETV